MSDCMTFPDTVEEFMEQYKIIDTEQVYTNGIEFVPIFRMKQWFEHLQAIEPERKTGRWFWTDGMYACDQCHEVLDEKSPFCPMCGADMRGDQDD